jgi:hypothetical protein
MSSLEILQPPNTDRPGIEVPPSAASLFAAAVAVIASAETIILEEQIAAAEIAAAIAWACVPMETARIFDAERAAWLASQHASIVAFEHNRMARRSVIAATLASEAFAYGLTAEELATTQLMSDGIGVILDAKHRVLRDHAPLHAAAQDHFRFVHGR